ncbi:MAG: hypothetical protein CMO66_06060 [Verrucomicrobiales bacterium]|nr:hypothetical protein [Verrucomicrobiales bacterium]
MYQKKSRLPQKSVGFGSLFRVVIFGDLPLIFGFKPRNGVGSMGGFHATWEKSTHLRRGALNAH